MAEIRLQRACVGALVGKLKAAGVTEHVRVRPEAKLTHLGRRSPSAHDLRLLLPVALPQISFAGRPRA
jgi:hypothetical protein